MERGIYHIRKACDKEGLLHPTHIAHEKCQQGRERSTWKGTMLPHASRGKHAREWHLGCRRRAPHLCDGRGGGWWVRRTLQMYPVGSFLHMPRISRLSSKFHPLSRKNSCAVVVFCTPHPAMNHTRPQTTSYPNVPPQASAGAEDAKQPTNSHITESNRSMRSPEVVWGQERAEQREWERTSGADSPGAHWTGTGSWGHPTASHRQEGPCQVRTWPRGEAGGGKQEKENGKGKGRRGWRGRREGEEGGSRKGQEAEEGCRRRSRGRAKGRAGGPHILHGAPRAQGPWRAESL